MLLHTEYSACTHAHIISWVQVRLMQLRTEYDVDGRAVYMDVPGLMRRRVKAAHALRRRMCLPREGTDVYRLINRCG